MPARRKHLVRIAKWVIAALVVVGLYAATMKAVEQWRLEAASVIAQVQQLEKELEQAADSVARQAIADEKERVQASVPRINNLNWWLVAVSGVLYGAGLLPSAMVLRGWLAVFGYRPSVKLVIASQTLGHIGKYVPGKAMVVVLRAGVLSKAGVAAVPATISIFLETFMMMAVGAVVAGIVICWLPVPTWMVLLSIAGAIAASIPTLPPVLRQVTARLLGRDSHLGAEAWRACGKGWAWSILTWILIGSSFAVLVTAIPSPQPIASMAKLWAISTAAISLALVAGFGSLLPGGAGVRELVLTTILSLVISPTQALLAAILARIVFICVEAVMAFFCWLYANQLDHPAAPMIAAPMIAATES